MSFFKWKVKISKFNTDKISTFQLVSIADQVGASLTQPETPKTGPEVIKLFSMLNSAEHEIYPAHKC